MALIQKARTVTLRDLNSDRTVNSGDSLASELGGDPLAIVGSTNDDAQQSARVARACSVHHRMTPIWRYHPDSM